MAIATGTAIAISAGMQLAGSVASAKMKSNAANKAAKTLQGSADKQMAHANQIYAPYLGMGSGAMTTLGDLMGVKPGSVPQVPGLSGTAASAAPQGLARIGANAPQQQVQLPPQNQPPQPMPGMPPPGPPPPGVSVGDMGMMPPPAAVARTQSGYGQVA